MKSHFNKVILLIGFSSILPAALLFVGVRSGLRHDWVRMGSHFFLAVYTVCCIIGGLLIGKIDTCFKRLAELIPGKLDSVRQRNPIVSITFFLFIIALLLFILAHFTAYREYWLLMGVFFSACVITLLISYGVIFTLKINANSRRLEKLISNYKECRVSKEQPGQ